MTRTCRIFPRYSRLVDSGVGHTHFVGGFERSSDLNQRSRSDTRASSAGIGPGVAIGDQYRPEGKQPTLRRLYRMDATARFSEEVALGVPRLPQSQPVPGAIDIVAFELRSRYLQVTCDPLEITLGDLTAIRTARNALEPQPLHACQMIACRRCLFPVITIEGMFNDALGMPGGMPPLLPSHWPEGCAG